MFIYSIRASTVKFFGFVLLTVCLIIACVGFGGEASAMASSEAMGVDYGGIKSNEDRVAFIKNFGIEIDETPAEEDTFTIPENFDRVISGYNELQKKQGLDITKYASKRVTRYTYKVKNYDADGEVYATVFVYRSRIVACDVSSASPTGFVVPLTLVDRAKLK